MEADVLLINRDDWQRKRICSHLIIVDNGVGGGGSE